MLSSSSHLVFYKFDSFQPLLPEEIHLWCARLTPNPGLAGYFRSLLDDEEKIQLDSFRFTKDQNRFLFSHGYLRTLLGLYVNEDPENLEIVRDELGKPYIKSRTVEFNLSHADNFALFGFTRHGKIGVDIERVHNVPESTDILTRLFSIHEKWLFFRTPTVNRSEVFFELWTRGEAVVKAAGFGFGGRVGAISKNKVKYAGKTWKLESFIPTTGYIGAIAFDNDPEKIQCGYLSDEWFSSGGTTASQEGRKQESIA